MASGPGGAPQVPFMVHPGGEMFIIHVDIQVKPECIEAFKQATLANAGASVREEGVARFDVLQGADDPACFRLVEVYRSPEDHGKHKRTAHYAAWAECVAAMMAEPRTGTKYRDLFPGDAGW